MKKLQLKQNSPDWLEYRRLKIGASDCPIIMCGTPSQKKALWEEKHGGKSRYSTPAMLNGSRFEGEALEKFNETMGLDFQSACFEREDFPWMMASVDGFDPFTEVHVEIKCPYTNETFETLTQKEIPIRYMWQLQHQLFVCNKDRCYFVVYNYRTQEISIREVEKNDTMISQLLKAEEEYYIKNLIGFEIPVFK